MDNQNSIYLFIYLFICLFVCFIFYSLDLSSEIIPAFEIHPRACRMSTPSCQPGKLALGSDRSACRPSLAAPPIQIFPNSAQKKTESEFLGIYLCTQRKMNKQTSRGGCNIEKRSSQWEVISSMRIVCCKGEKCVRVFKKLVGDRISEGPFCQNSHYIMASRFCQACEG